MTILPKLRWECTESVRWEGSFGQEREGGKR